MYAAIFETMTNVEKSDHDEETMEAPGSSLSELGEGIAVGAPRSDLHVPTAAARNAERLCALFEKQMAVRRPILARRLYGFRRISGDMAFAGDGIRREKTATMPGKSWLGIVMLFSSGER